MKLLVTGAGGRIGSAFVSNYGSNYDLRLADFKLPEDSDLRSAGQWLQGDLADRAFARECVEGMDCVIHLAANPSGEATFEQLLPNNIVATYNVFQTAGEAGVKRVIFASTIQTIYGYPEDVVVTPDMPPRPVNLYGASKAWGEALCAVYANKGMSCFAVRIGAFMAPEQLADLGRPEMMKEFVAEEDLSQLLHLMVQAPPNMKLEIFHGLSDNAVKRISIDKEEQVLGYEPSLSALPPDAVQPDSPEG